MRTGICLTLLLVLGWQGQDWLRAEQASVPENYVVAKGTRIPLVMVNSVSTKTSRVGDRVYLQTSFPIAANGRIVIPEGSYVTGTITQVQRPGRIKGKGEMYLRFDTLMLRNGVQRNFSGTVSGLDGAGENTLSGKEGNIEGEASKGKDVGTVAQPAAAGATIGAIAGNSGKGAAIGGGVGAAAGLGAVLLTRGPEVRLLRGSPLEMELNRDLSFTKDEVNFLGSASLPPIPRAPRDGGNSSSRPSIPSPLGGVF